MRRFNAGGAERQLLTYLANIDPVKIEITVACFYHGNWHAEAITTSRAKIVALEKRGRYDVISFLSSAVRCVRQTRATILYGYGDSTWLPSVAIGKLMGLKVVWGIRSSLVTPAINDKVWSAIARISCWLSRFTDGCIVNSDAGSNAYISAGYPPKSMKVIPNGIDVQTFRHDPLKRREFRKLWNIANSEVLVGYVARLDPIKDYETFLRAAAFLLNRNGSFKFVCIGPSEGDYAMSLKALASSLRLDGHLIWSGYQRDVAAVYSALDINVLCSRSEGFPNSLCEAMACETPCVATNVGDCSQILGGLGRPVTAGSANELAAEIERLSEQDLRAIGKSSRARIKDLYSVEKMSRDTTDYFVKLAAS